MAVKRRYIEFGIVLILIVAAMGIAMAQTFIDVRAAPAGTVFPFVHGYAEDYYTYLHLMRQGWEGAWTATSRMTTEVYPAQFVNFGFLLFGHLSRIFHTSLPVMYTIARVAGGIVLLLSTYFILCETFPNSMGKRVFGMYLVIFSMYSWGNSFENPQVPLLTHTWVELDPMVRLSYIPHHLWSKVFMVLSFLFLHRSITRPTVRDFLILGITVVFMAMMSPVAIATFVPTVGLWLGFIIITKCIQNRRFVMPNLTPWIVSFVPTLFFTVYYRGLETGVHPWVTYKAWEETVRYPINLRTYIESFGPMIFVFLLTIPLLLRRGGIWFLHISWAISGWVMIFIMNRFIPLSNIRFVEGYQFIPVAMVSVEGIRWISQKITRGNKTAWLAAMSIVSIVVFVYALVGFRASMREHEAYLQNDVKNPGVYVPTVNFTAMQFLGDTTPSDTVVMAPYAWSILLPAFTGVRVVGGHRLFTVAYEKKLADIALFYTLKDREKLLALIRQYGVGYIVSDSPAEGLENLVRDQSIKPIWLKGTVVIYQVIGEGEGQLLQWKYRIKER